MEAQSLKLTMIQGPRQGETLEFRPGTQIRVGRVVRGNNVNIKDKGISTKHLLMEVDESGKWKIQDLDSSNGTVLNGVKLTPLEPVDLRDGDVVKIGELTSVSVSICASIEMVSEVRGNPRRGGRMRKCRDLGSTTENAELSNVEPAVEMQGGNMRVTRGRKKKNEDSVSEVMDDSKLSTLEPTVEILRANERVTRGRKKKQDAVIQVPEVRAEVEEKQTRRRGKEREVNVGNLDLGSKDGEVLVKPCKVEVTEEEELGLVDVEDGGVGVNDTDGTKGVEELENLREEQTEVVDFEKMTMKDWFSYMEANLVKQIIDQTEEMIEEMRTKARRVEEYLKQQKKDKAGIK